MDARSSITSEPTCGCSMSQAIVLNESDVQLASSRAHRNRKFEPAVRHLESIDLHPKGQSVAVTARGGAYVMDLWEGAPRGLSGGSESRDRLATWLPDGERLVAVSDEGGEERLVVFRADGTEVSVGRCRLTLADRSSLRPHPPGPIASQFSMRDKKC